MLSSSPALRLFAILLLGVYCDGRRNGNGLAVPLVPAGPSILNRGQFRDTIIRGLLVARQSTTCDAGFTTCAGGGCCPGEFYCNGIGCCPTGQTCTGQTSGQCDSYGPNWVICSDVDRCCVPGETCSRDSAGNVICLSSTTTSSPIPKTTSSTISIGITSPEAANTPSSATTTSPTIPRTTSSTTSISTTSPEAASTPSSATTTSPTIPKTTRSTTSIGTTSPEAASTPSSAVVATSARTSTPIGAIVAGVGGVVVLVAVIGIFICCHRRQTRQPADALVQPNAPYQQYGTEYPTSQPRVQSIVSTLPNGAVVMSAGGYDPYRDSLYGATTAASPASSTAGDRAQAQSELRNGRQLELDRKIQDIHREMEQLRQEESKESTQSSIVASRDEFVSPSDDAETRRQMEMMQEQIKVLQKQLATPWAQGLSNEPPPGYSAMDKA